MIDQSYASEGFDAYLTRTPNNPTQNGLTSRTISDEMGFDPMGGDVPLIARSISPDRPNVFSLKSQTPNDIKNGIPQHSITLDQLTIDQLGITDYISSIGFETGVQGWIIRGNGDAEFNSGTFRGALTAATIDIGGSDSSSFHVDIDGNMWSGAATFASGPFRVTNAGDLTATSATITGSVTATSGAIGGWTVGSNYIRDAAGVVGMSSAVTGGDDIRFWAGDATPASAEFRVTESGALTATSATITGAITATSGAIGGWTVGSDYIRDAAGVVGLSSAVTGGDDIRFWAGDATPGSAEFRVTESGALTATSATITGAITATSGAIGGWTVGTDYIRDAAGVVGMSSAVTGGDDIRFWAGDATPGNAEFRVTEAGALTASSATITGSVTATSGAIGGFDIGSDYVRDAANSFGLASTVTGGDDVRFWAGDTFANRATAPFRITEAGDITAGTGATISTNTGFKNRLYQFSPANFTNPGNIATSDNTYATATTATSQVYGGFDFNIPNNATIVGIEATLEGHDNHAAGTAATARVQLSHDEGVTFTNQSTYTLTLTDTTDSSQTFGGAAYLWGRSWTVNEFLESNFRVKVEIVAMNSATTVSFDHVQLKVYYTYTSQFTYDGTDIAVAGGTITGGKIASATSGARIEMTTLGLRSYDGNSDKRIEMSDDSLTFLLGTAEGYGFAGKIYTAGDSSSASLVMQPSGSGVAVVVNPELYQRYTGWVNFNETLTYASSTTFTITGDRTDRLAVGTRIKLVQTTTKYFIVTAVSYSNPTTTVTAWGGTDYTIANAAITSPYYSHEKAPVGFPVDPDKWTVETTDATERTQATPTQDTWYNLNSNAITLPIGAWDVYYQVTMQVSATNLAGMVTLSTANNTESDSEMTSLQSTGDDTAQVAPHYRRKNIVVAASTPYYLNVMCPNGSATDIRINPSLGGNISPLVIRAVSAYL